MLRTLLIDDEYASLEVLTGLITHFCPQIELLGAFENPEKGLEMIQKHKPDLIFLDVEMPFYNGFAMLEQLPSIDFETIFVTAFDHYAMQAIKHNALDYLLKPVGIDELRQAVARAELQIRSKQQLAPALVPHKICLPVQDGFFFANIHEIIRCESSGNYTWFYFANQDKMLICKNLKEYEAALPPDVFFRVHHSHLINLNFVQKLYRGKNTTIEMADGAIVELASRRKDVFLSRFKLP